MIVADVPSKSRPKLSWKEVLNSREDYKKAEDTGMAHVWWKDFPTPQEFDEYLKENEVE